jgi:hypothetical protein
MEYHNNLNGQKTKFFKVVKAWNMNSARLMAIVQAQSDKAYKHGNILIESVECYVKA